MLLDPRQIAPRDRLIITGLYLSKYNALALKRLGFTSFTEAFNAIGYALGSRPASIKNYRDEFDPLFPNGRKGWHKRPIRSYCLKVLEEYRSLDLDSFASLIESLVGYDENTWSITQVNAQPEQCEQAFGERLITGLAAERYFENMIPRLPEFAGYTAENTTRLGCGYDFRLERTSDDDFIAVEVKGLKGRSGTLSMTPKEHGVAELLGERFFLFVVRNFQEVPYHEVIQDPLAGRLRFTKVERPTVVVSWLANV